MLADGDLLHQVTMPPDTLVVMIKRRDKYLVPTGGTRLYLTDRLLLISQNEKHLTTFSGGEKNSGK